MNLVIENFDHTTLICSKILLKPFDYDRLHVGPTLINGQYIIIVHITVVSYLDKMFDRLKKKH